MTLGDVSLNIFGHTNPIKARLDLIKGLIYTQVTLGL